MQHMQKQWLTLGFSAVTLMTAILPSTSQAGVVSMLDKVDVTAPSLTENVHWLPYRHHHHRWHTGWHYGWPRYRYGLYAGYNPAMAPPATYAYGNGCAGSYGYAPGYGGGSWGAAANPFGTVVGAATDIVAAPFSIFGAASPSGW
jgi:hypothetical protein